MTGRRPNAGRQPLLLRWSNGQAGRREKPCRSRPFSLNLLDEYYDCSRLPGRVIPASYLFKPKTPQLDAVAEAVRDLRNYGFTQDQYNLTLARFMEYAIDRALEELRLCRGKFALELKEYLYRRNPDL